MSTAELQDKSLAELQEILKQKNIELGRWQMYKTVLELTIPVASMLPASYVAALQRIDPHGTP